MALAHNVADVFKDAWKHPDGIAAYAVSGLCIGILVFAFLTQTLFPSVMFLKRVLDDAILLTLMPLVMLTSYCWLNGSYLESPNKRRLNAVLILFISFLFLFRVVVGYAMAEILTQILLFL